MQPFGSNSWMIYIVLLTQIEDTLHLQQCNERRQTLEYYLANLCFLCLHWNSHNIVPIMPSTAYLWCTGLSRWPRRTWDKHCKMHVGMLLRDSNQNILCSRLLLCILCGESWLPGYQFRWSHKASNFLHTKQTKPVALSIALIDVLVDNQGATLFGAWEEEHRTFCEQLRRVAESLGATWFESKQHVAIWPERTWPFGKWCCFTGNSSHNFPNALKSDWLMVQK